jgi:hypothetical protein
MRTSGRFRIPARNDAEALIKQAAAGRKQLELYGTSATVGTGFVQIAMKLLHRYSGLRQRMIAERLEGLDKGLVSHALRAIRERIETEPKIGTWFQDLTRLNT